VLHAVPKQVLQQLDESVPVGRDGAVCLDDQFGVGRRHVRPRGVRHGTQFHLVGRLDDCAMSGEFEEVRHEPLHPVEGVLGLADVGWVAGLAGDVELAFRDVEWVAEVVADDAGELRETLVLTLQFLPRRPLLEFLTSTPR
jgi:hypothetical protein